MLICTSCGDSWSDYAYSIDNQTKYDIILYFNGQESENQNPILCPSNKETIILKMKNRSIKKLDCNPFPLKEHMTFVIDEEEKHLIKDFFDVNNWKCTGDEDWSLIMVGNYYSYIKSTFIITEEDLE